MKEPLRGIHFQTVPEIVERCKNFRVLFESCNHFHELIYSRIELMYSNIYFFMGPKSVNYDKNPERMVRKFSITEVNAHVPFKNELKYCLSNHDCMWCVRKADC